MYACVVQTTISHVHQYSICKNAKQNSFIPFLHAKVMRNLPVCKMLQEENYSALWWKIHNSGAVWMLNNYQIQYCFSYFFFYLSADNQHNKYHHVQYSHSSKAKHRIQTHADPRHQRCNLHPHATQSLALARTIMNWY